ncbi:26S proteasome non-ATPase regulatory subunit 14 [Hordeum vulgare]|nr:26S proteasome non-ATPase regulatory subunit 14 [Hordeum vulgare]
MAGRGHPQQPPPAQPPARLTGQGNRPPQQSGRTAASVASAGAQALAEANRQQPRGRWGDDGVNAYGDGQHRGSSSSGGGRGYAWQNNGGGGNGFNAPPGKFVLGISGPPNPKRGRFRQNWGGRGGGRKPKPPLPPQDVPVEKDEPNKAPTKEAAKDSSLIQAHGNVADPLFRSIRTLLLARGKEVLPAVSLGEYLARARTVGNMALDGGCNSNTFEPDERTMDNLALEGGVHSSPLSPKTNALILVDGLELVSKVDTDSAQLAATEQARAGVPMEVMGLMLGEFVDEYTVTVVDAFAMPQSDTGVSVEADGGDGASLPAQEPPPQV